jgi:hypothetical protein
MNRTRFFMLLVVVALLFGLVPQVPAQIGEISDEGTQQATGGSQVIASPVEEMSGEEVSGVRVGLQASTNFQEMLVGLKIQMDNFAVTPKFGFFVQSLKDRAGNVFNFGVGSGLDYYFSPGKKLRPYVGGDFLIYIPHIPDDTDIWFVISPHVGAEYWLSTSFSIGGNLGVQFGVGDSFYTPNTIGLVESAKSDFSFGINGMLNLTYYF